MPVLTVLVTKSAEGRWRGCFVRRKRGYYLHIGMSPGLVVISASFATLRNAYDVQYEGYFEHFV